MKTIISIIVMLVIIGCGPSQNEIVRENFKRQYAELEKIENPELRRQKFEELTAPGTYV